MPNTLSLEQARQFVLTVQRWIEAGLLPPTKVGAGPVPGRVDYGTAKIGSVAPAGGWLSDAEVKSVAQGMTEAIAAEKWFDGVKFAVQLVILAGGL